MNFRVLFPTLMLVAIAIAGCGGGTGGSSPLIPAPTATPHVGPTTIPPTSSPQTVSISGAGYTLAFTLPAVTTGNAASVTATLQATPPANVPVVQVRRRSIPGAPVGLVYLTLTTTATVGFSSLPSFTWTLPSATTIPSGSYGYMSWWDPIGAGQWQTHLGPSTPSGTTLTFPGTPNYGITLTAGQTYVYALTTNTQTVPTATPAPTPTSTPTSGPTSAPSPAATPAYCAGFATPVPLNGINPQPVQIVDNNFAKYGDQVVMYLTESDANTGLNSYLGTDGNLHQFTTGATAPPLPLNCFPGSNGGSGLTFEVPPPPGAANSGENLYIALVSPTSPSSVTAPNPLAFTGTGTGTNVQPGIVPGSASSGVPFDFVELGLPTGVVDTTQVGAIGLPLEVSVLNGGAIVAGPAGLPSGAYSRIQSALSSGVNATLLVAGTLNNQPVLERILNPERPYLGFPPDYFYNPSYAPQGYTDPTFGYLGYVLNQYKSAPALYTLAGVAPSSQSNYCASYDGSANVIWWNVGSATTCSATPPQSPTWNMSVVNYLEYTGQIDSNACTSQILAMPWGPGSPLFKNFTNPDFFYLWKAMVVELVRGQALQAQTHPVGGWGKHASSFSTTFTKFDPLYSQYWKAVHLNSDSSLAYAIPYDDLGAWYSGFNNTSGTLKISIDTLPAPAVTNPSPPPNPSPTACPVATPTP